MDVTMPPMARRPLNLGSVADARGVSFATDLLWDFWRRYPSMRRVVWFT